MRISTAWAQQQSVNSMNSQQAKLALTQQQLNSSLRVTTPADDPAAAVKILDLNGTIAKTTQYQSNIATARGRLNIEESALTTSVNILDRAKELTIQGMNATLNASDRLSIKTEVDQLIQEMAGAANTQNANGEYVFSGDLATVPAFTQNPSGEYVYQGGPQQRVMQIGPARQVADSDLGFNVFDNIKSSSPAADQNGNRSIFDTLQALSSALASPVPPVLPINASSGEITGARFMRYGLDYTGATTTFSLTATAESTAPSRTVPPTKATLSQSPIIDLSGLSDKKLASVDDVVAEINKQLTAIPLTAADVWPNTVLKPNPTPGTFSDAIQARSNGNRIEFVSVDTGTGSSITINNVSGTFLADAGFSDGQTKVGVDAQVVQGQLGDVLTDLAAAQDSFLQAQTSIGTRVNALDDQESQNAKFVLDTQGTLSQTQDLDYAQAYSNFQLQTLALQSAQQAYAKVKGLSLFNYL
jgi:flagellar hook-associated protein 3 FlgL